MLQGVLPRHGVTLFHVDSHSDLRLPTDHEKFNPAPKYRCASLGARPRRA